MEQKYNKDNIDGIVFKYGNRFIYKIKKLITGNYRCIPYDDNKKEFVDSTDSGHSEDYVILQLNGGKAWIPIESPIPEHLEPLITF